MIVGIGLPIWLAMGLLHWHFERPQDTADMGRFMVGHPCLLPLYLVSGWLMWMGPRRKPPQAKTSFVVQRGLVAFGLPLWLATGPASALSDAAYDLTRVDWPRVIIKGVVLVGWLGAVMGELLWRDRGAAEGPAA